MDKAEKSPLLQMAKNTPTQYWNDSCSVIITSNRAFDEWAEVFNNDLLASAALDRLTHHTHTLTIRGDSFRHRNRKKEALPSTLP